jgi:hypothetical protein
MINKSTSTSAQYVTLHCTSWRQLPVSKWLDSLIAPGGLLLVLFHLFAIPILVLSVAGGVGKKVDN